MDATLNITSINATEDGGVYECVVINAAGHGSDTATLNVRPIIVEDPVDVETSVGDNITLSCRVESFPRNPLICWDMLNPNTNMFEVVPGSGSSGLSSVLELNVIQFSNFGLYRCCASGGGSILVCSNNATVTGE